MKRIGLFGGTFNPIHLGHIQVIQEVKKGFGLDKIFIIPSALTTPQRAGRPGGCRRPDRDDPPMLFQTTLTLQFLTLN